MGKFKVTVYAISKNEEQFVDRWMDAVSSADEVVVLDTGSTDNTVEKLRARGARVEVEIINPWRFDIARNRSMDMISEDTDICVMNDIDEVFEDGWREKLEDAWSSEFTRARYTFVWTHNPDGTIKKKYNMEKIHIRKGYRWVHPVHELLEYTGEKPEKTLEIFDIVLHHYPDDNKPRSQYLPLLELSVKESPFNDRATFWLGREYMYYEKYEEAIHMLKRHLLLPTARWDQERSASMRFIGFSYWKIGNIAQAKTWFYKSIGECSNIRESYMGFIKFGYEQKDWALVYSMVIQALRYGVKKDSYLVEVDSWNHTIYDMGAIACYNLGLYKIGMEYAQQALDLDPMNKRLQENYGFFVNKLSLAKENDSE
jgi:glycosyltransferase involved in cell wall biosynthesis